MSNNKLNLNWKGLVLSLLIVHVLQITGGVPKKDSFKLRTTASRPYRGYFTYVISDFDMLFQKVLKERKHDTFEFSTDTEPEVKWFIALMHYSTTLLQLHLFLKSLPSDIDKVSGYFECGVLDSKGNKLEFKKNRTSVTINHFFVTYISLTKVKEKAEELLPNEQLTIFFDVKGVLLPKEKNASQIITEPIREHVNVRDCAKEIVLDTVDKQNQQLFKDKSGEDIMLRSQGKSFKCKGFFVFARMPLFTTVVPVDALNTKGRWYDFSEQINDDELEDMVTFMYRGMAPNLNKTCRVLYGAAKSYGFECLSVTCEELLMGQVKATNARELMDLARKIGSGSLEKMAAFCIYKPEDAKCLA